MTAERRWAITLKLLKPAWTPQWKRGLLLNNRHSQHSSENAVEQKKITAGLFFFLCVLCDRFLPQIVYYALQEARYSCVTRLNAQVQKSIWSAWGHRPESSASVLEPDWVLYALPMRGYWSLISGGIHNKCITVCVTLKYPWKNNKQASSVACVR